LIRALQTLRGHLTVIVVTHRPSLLSLCDRLMILEGGHATWSVPAPSGFVRVAS
jgi:ABC-type protease/lipase transport system fused ATPase/permease subunit